MGLKFKTTLAHSVIELRLREAMARFRYDCPFVAASISESSSAPGQFDWIYSAAHDYNQVLDWLDAAVHTHYNILDLDDFITSINQKRLPYEGPHSLVVVCHVVFTTGDQHALLLHGTHAILDATPIMNALRFLVTSISNPGSSSASSMNWGLEWKNLPEGPIRSTGGLDGQHEAEFPRLVARLKALREKPPSLGLEPQRSAIQRPGYPVRVHQTVPAETFLCVRNKLKEIGMSLTYLLEAATILTVFGWNSSTKKLSDADHVIFDPARQGNSSNTILILTGSIVYNFSSPRPRHTLFQPSVNVAIGVDFQDIRYATGYYDQLLHVAGLLKSQYASWLSSQHLPSLTSVYLPSAFPSPYAVYITNLGAVENSMPLTYQQDNTGQPPILSIENIILSHRLVTTRPIIHTWSIRSTLHLQIVACDVWDPSYLEKFLGGVVETALRILDGQN
ncbi:hypothetical protein DFH09DRAFT_1481379 [Mycena vulgaris]|nr:hypothetical protein DFH09DRAFT_1481379 [Mycena vulgaris]